MRKALLALMLVPGFAAAQDGISVSGTGSVSVAPDCASLNLMVGTAKTDPSAAYQTVRENTDSVLSVLKTAGVEDKDVATVGYSFNPTFNEKNQPTGWMVVHRLNVKVRKVADVGKVMDAVVKSKANVESLKYEVSNREAAISKARDLAVADATRKAQQLAKGFGANLGPVKSVTEQSGRSSSVYEDDSVMRTASVGGPAPGQQGIVVNLSVTFVVK